MKAPRRRATSLAIRDGLPPDEWQFVKGLSEGKDAGELGADLGWHHEKVAQMLRNPRLMTAVAMTCASHVGAIALPRAIRVLEGMMSGGFAITKIDDNGTKTEQIVMVKPETGLAAAKAIIQIAGLDKPIHADKTNDTKDLHEMTPDEMRAEIAALEGSLAELAKSVDAQDNAPMPASRDVMDEEDASIINVLD